MPDQYPNSRDPSGASSWRDIVGVQSHARRYPQIYTPGAGRYDEGAYRAVNPPSAADFGARPDTTNFESVPSLGTRYQPVNPENTRIRERSFAEIYSDESENEGDALEEEDRKIRFEEQGERGYVRHGGQTVRSAVADMYDETAFSESESSFAQRTGGRAPGDADLVPLDFGARQQSAHPESTTTSHSFPSLAGIMATSVNEGFDRDLDGPAPGVTKYGARQGLTQRASPRLSTPLPGIDEILYGGPRQRAPTNLGYPTAQNHSTRPRPTFSGPTITSNPALSCDARGKASTDMRYGPRPHDFGEVARPIHVAGNMAARFDCHSPSRPSLEYNIGYGFPGPSYDTRVSAQPPVTQKRREWHPLHDKRVHEMSSRGVTHSKTAESVQRSRKDLSNHKYYFNQKERDKKEAQARAESGVAPNVPKLREREPGEGGQKVKWTAEAAKWVQDRVNSLQSQRSNQISLSKAADMVAAELEVGNPGMVFSGGGLRHQLKRWEKAPPAGK